VQPSNEVTPLPIPASPEPTYADQFRPTNEAQSVDPNNPAWGVPGALIVWLVGFLVQAIFPLFFLVPYVIHRGLNPSSPDFARAAIELAVSDKTAIFLQILSILPTHIFTLLLVWVLVTRFGKRPFLASLGLFWSGHLEVWVSVAGGIVLFGVATFLAKLLGAEKPTQLEQLINSSLAARYAIAALAVFTAPFIEEFTYRGVLYSALQRLIGVKGAVIFVLGLFTLIHVPQYWPNLGVIAAVALLSIVLTIVRARTGRLLPCIVIHMAFNAVQAGLLLLQPFSERYLPSPKPPIPPSTIIFPLIRLLF
jgi:membrane protease YdiL (CAAX protease family)